MNMDLIRLFMMIGWLLIIAYRPFVLMLRLLLKLKAALVSF